MSGSFTDQFGGGTIAVSQPSYLALAMSANVDLSWPIEQADSILTLADTIDVDASVPGLEIFMPDATQGSTGSPTAVFNNVGAQTVTIVDSTGATILSLVSGSAWVVYLYDNTTPAGLWRTFQLGASVSVAVAAALAGAGLKAIGLTLNEKMVVVPQNANYVILQSDRASVEQWVGGVGQFTLPDPGVVGADWFVVVKNSGSGNLTVNTAAGNIDGSATAVFAPGGSAWFVNNGTNYFSLGEGGTGSGGSGFNFISIDVSGSGNFVLAGVQLNQIGYRFTGVLTGNRNIVVPGTAQEYWVDNETTGAFTLQVQTAGQVAPAPPVILQGNRNILYCDGTNVIAAETATVSFPISVVQGGTGATTAATARTNLGATTVGNSLFTAVSAGAAQAAIGAAAAATTITAGFGLTGGGDLSANRTLAVVPSALFQGAVVTNTTNQFAGPAGSIQLAWNAEVTDIGAWHDTVTHNSRLTIPAGVAYAEISALIGWQAGLASSDEYISQISIFKNGSAFTGAFIDGRISTTSSAVFNTYLTSVTTGPIAVVPGDYFELNITGSNAANTQGIEILCQFGRSQFMAKALG